MLKSLQSLFALRKGLVGVLLVMIMFAPSLIVKTRAEDPPYYGQIIRTNYYQDETFTGIYVQCEYNTCTDEEECLGQKTDFGVEVNRVAISCDGFFPPSN